MRVVFLLTLACSEPQVLDTALFEKPLSCEDPPEFQEMVRHMLHAKCVWVEQCYPDDFAPEDYYACMMGSGTMPINNDVTEHCLDYCVAVDMYYQWLDQPCDSWGPSYSDAFYVCEEEEW